MRPILFTLLLLGCIAVNAQKKTIKYSNITSIGLLSGSSQNAFTFQTINGIKIDKWRVGIGVGLDDYGATTVPVFIDVRRSFGNKKWQPLAYADAGIDCPLRWGNFGTKVQNQYYYDVYNTFFGEAGVGVSKKIGKKVSLNIMAGFSYKHLSYAEKDIYAYTYPILAGSNYPYGPSTQFDFYYKRLALKIGLQF